MADDSAETGEQVADASRRTHLANERTYLAWLRTGLTAFAVAIGVGKVVPALTDESEVPYAVVGIGFALLGVALVLYGLRRMAAVQEALTQGRFTAPGRIVLAALATLAVALGAALVVLLIVFS
jgi:putative membrane protein